jgi:phosphoglycerol transferase
MTKILKNIFQYSAASILSLLIFAILFQIWKTDFSLPIFSYNNDSLFYIFVIKNIIDTGWFFSNPSIGLPHFTEIFSIYDFPIQADLFQILIIKFFTYFSDNPFLIANCFFILTFALISGASFIVLRSFQISIFTAIVISVLYTFLPYHFVRNIRHLFLSNYMLVPFAVMVGIWIASDKISVAAINKKGQYCFSLNKLFLISAVICALIAISGVYYAYYSCVIFSFAWILRGLKKENFFDKNSLAAIVLCAVIFAILSHLYLPTSIYQLKHGFNGEVVGRGAGESEFYGLRIINLLLPVSNHYLNYFSNLTNHFKEIVSSESERISESLGFIASTGFLFLILWLVGKNFEQENSFLKKTIKKFSLKKNEQNLISNLAALNILSVIFATSGGLVMLFSLAFPLIRSHARFCVFIAFISLFLVAIIFDKIIEKKLFGKKLLVQILLFVIMVFGVLDQVGVVSNLTAQSDSMKNRFDNDRNFIAKIENSQPAQTMIFVLPSYGFPEEANDNYNSLIAYIHSKNLRWSYPAIRGRESSKWQKKIVNQDFETFIAAIKKEGFKGIYLDRLQYFENYGGKKLVTLEQNLRSIAVKPVMVSQNAQLVFFEI